MSGYSLRFYFRGPGKVSVAFGNGQEGEVLHGEGETISLALRHLSGEVLKKGGKWPAALGVILQGIAVAVLPSMQGSANTDASAPGDGKTQDSDGPGGSRLTQPPPKKLWVPK